MYKGKQLTHTFLMGRAESQIFNNLIYIVYLFLFLFLFYFQFSCQNYELR